jgi:flagellar basal-body rod protein FlgB
MDLTTEAVRLGINMSRVRAEIASDNIAHADVTGFRPMRADFGNAVGLLREAETSSSLDGEDLQAITPATLHATAHFADADPSAPVHLDAEVAELESANVDFQTLTTVMSRRFALMQLAMTGGN